MHQWYVSKWFTETTAVKRSMPIVWSVAITVRRIVSIAQSSLEKKQKKKKLNLVVVIPVMLIAWYVYVYCFYAVDIKFKGH